MAKLSDFELDIMSCFWGQKQLSAPEVHRLLGVERGVTYSTIKSLIDRLEAKGALTRAETPGRVIYYRAAVKQDKVRKPLVKSFLRRLYGDDLRPFFAQLLSDDSLSDDELAYLRELLRDTGDKK